MTTRDFDNDDGAERDSPEPEPDPLDRGLGAGASSALEQLRRRKVFQWSAAYLATAWLILQVLDFLRENFGWSPAIVRSVTFLLAVGFVGILVLSWYHGERGRQRPGPLEILLLGGLTVVGVVAVALSPDSDPAAETDAASESDPASQRVMRGADPSVTIAIIPFEHRTTSGDDADLAEGLAMQIGSRLSKVADIRPIASSSVLAALETGPASSAAVGRELGADYVLEGVVAVEGNTVRVTAELIDVETLGQIWSHSYDSELRSFFDLHSEVALGIADALEATLTSDERSRIEASPTRNLDAYRLYERQRGLFGTVPAQNRLGMELLEEAIALDSMFAEAFARLAWRLVWEIRLGRSEAVDSARALAERATRLDSTSSDAFYSLAVVATIDPRGGATRAFRRALELDPSNPAVLTDLSYALTSRGELEEAADYAVRAVRIQPNSGLVRWHLFVPLFALAMDDRARRLVETSLDRFPPDDPGRSRNEIALTFLALVSGSSGRARELALAALSRFEGRQEPEVFAAEVLTFVGEWESALAVYERYLGTPQAYGGWLRRSVRTHAAFLLWRRGETDVAAAMLDESLEAARAEWTPGTESYAPAFEAASVYAIRGATSEALEWLTNAYDAGFRWYRHLAVDPMFESIRGEQRFGELLERMRSDVERRAANVEAEGIGARIDEVIHSDSGIDQ
ncbi:MAG: hypothetical protein R3195_07270 [Gemmatimonadota bacterium]|nr:hypothetical protein [Gemmatimonadota bacterium]